MAFETLLLPNVKKMYEIILFSQSDPDDKYVAGTYDSKEMAEEFLKGYLDGARTCGLDTSGYVRETD